MKKIIILIVLYFVTSCSSSKHCEAYGSVYNQEKKEVILVN